MKKALKTKDGVLTPDAAGVDHYQYEKFNAVDMAAKDAIEHRRGPTWFWFNGTPAPISERDTVPELINRWSEWRNSFQTNAQVFLKQIAKFSGVNYLL